MSLESHAVFLFEANEPQTLVLSANEEISFKTIEAIAVTLLEQHHAGFIITKFRLMSSVLL